MDYTYHTAKAVVNVTGQSRITAMTAAAFIDLVLLPRKLVRDGSWKRSTIDKFQGGEGMKANGVVRRVAASPAGLERWEAQCLLCS